MKIFGQVTHVIGFSLLMSFLMLCCALSVTRAQSTLHFAANTSSTVSQAISNGFNLVDVTGSTSNPTTTINTLNALPSGVQALVWVGNLDNAPPGSSCPAPGFSDTQFHNLVNALAGNSKVYGYYVSDEPHPSVCPSAAADIAARSDYIHNVAPGQKSFIIVQDGNGICGATLGCEYSVLTPATTHADYIGLDPYPCHYSGATPVACDNSVIVTKFNTAVSKGISVSAIIPVFQTFGQEGRIDGKSVFYRTPSSSELQSMLDTWASLTPTPAFDYAYTWGAQCTVSSCLSPKALVNQPSLAAVMSAHNAQPSSGGSSGSSSSGSSSGSSSSGSGSISASSSKKSTSGTSSGGAATTGDPQAAASGQAENASPQSKPDTGSFSLDGSSDGWKPIRIAAAGLLLFGGVAGYLVWTRYKTYRKLQVAHKLH
jgi:hypothetical protein